MELGWQLARKRDCVENIARMSASVIDSSPTLGLRVDVVNDIGLGYYSFLPCSSLICFLEKELTLACCTGGWCL